MPCDWEEAFAAVGKEERQLGSKSAVMDGERVVLLSFIDLREWTREARAIPGRRLCASMGFGFGQHTEHVARPDLFNVLAGISRTQEGGGNPGQVGHVIETRNPAATVPVEPDADMIGPCDLERVQQVGQEVVECRPVGFGIKAIDLAPLGEEGLAGNG